MTEPLLDRARIEELLREADCSAEFTQRFLAALETAPPEDLVCLLRCQRCRQLERVHDEQRKLDILDHLRYQLEKACGNRCRGTERSASHHDK